MNGKQRRHQGAGPKIAGHLSEEQEEQDGVGSVQQEIGQVVSAGVIQPMELTIQHVGKPSQRVPVVGMKVRKGPDNSTGTETLRNLGIIYNIIVIVVLKEVVPKRLAENKDHRQQQERAYRRYGIAVGMED